MKEAKHATGDDGKMMWEDQKAREVKGVGRKKKWVIFRKKKDMMNLGTQKKLDMLNLGRICFCNTIVAYDKQRNV